MFDRWALRILLLVVGGVPLLFVLDLKDTFDLPKMVFVYLSVMVLAGLWGWEALEKKEIHYRPTPLNRPLAAFLILAFISAYYSIEPMLSFWGAYRIYVFGCFPMSAFAALYWFSAQIQDATYGEKIRRAAMISGALVGLYALLQYYGVEPFERMPGAQGGRPWGSLGNPLYMGALCMMAVALGLFEWRGFWVTPFALATVGLILSLSRSAWFGFLAAFMLCALKYKKSVKSGYKAIGFLFIAIGMLFWVFPLARERALVLVSTHEGSNAARVAGWKGALEVLKDHPWLGAGPDTFFVAFRPHRSFEYVHATGSGVTQADAHNDILQVVSTMGVIGLGAFLWVLGVAARLLWRSARLKPDRNDERWKIGMAAALSALFIQNQFNFSSVSTTAWAAVFLGALAGCEGERKRVVLPLWVHVGVARVILIGIFFLALGFIGRPLLADFYHQEGLASAAGGRLEKSVHYHREAVHLHGRIAEYETEYANRCRDTGRFEEAWATAERLVRDHPANPDVWNNRGVVAMWITQMAKINRMADAEASFRHAVDLDPLFVDAWANLARWEHLAGHLDKENALWEKVLEINPTHEMARQVLHR